MNRLPIIGSFACLAAAVGVGYLLVPGPLEQVTMLMRDGRYEEAVERANSFVSQGNRQSGLLLQTFFLNERFGDPDDATIALQYYVERNPHNTSAWKRAAETYAASGQVDNLILALENVVRLSKDVEAATHLVHLYRLHSRFDDELRILRLTQADELDPLDRTRLAVLLIGNEELEPAVKVLVELDTSGKVDGLDPYGRNLLFAALIDLGDLDIAVERARTWFAKDGDWRFLELHITYLLRSGADEAAIGLATTPTLIENVDFVARLASLFAQESRSQLVQRVIESALDYAQGLPNEQLDWYLFNVVNTARYAGLDTEIFRQFNAVLNTDRPLVVQASFAQTIYNLYGYEALLPFRDAIHGSVLQQRPVLAARLLLRERNSTAARRYLLDADLTILSERDCYDWMATAEQLLAPHELVEELALRARNGSIPLEVSRLAMNVASRQGTQPRLNELWTYLVLHRPEHAGQATGTLID